MSIITWPSDLRPTRQDFTLESNTLLVTSPFSFATQAVSRLANRWVIELGFDFSCLVVRETSAPAHAATTHTHAQSFPRRLLAGCGDLDEYGFLPLLTLDGGPRRVRLGDGVVG